jgi:hypothetical protein
MGDQLDLFSGSGAATGASAAPRPAALVPAELDDAAIVAAILDSGLADTLVVVAEAGRRRLAAAIPVLAALCHRFTGFGGSVLVPEQAAALEALAAIGGREAAKAMATLFAREAVTGPTLAVAVRAAANLQPVLPAGRVTALLRHADPGIRTDSCRCARPSPEIIAVLIDLMEDLDGRVSTAAACALGRMGREEARAALIARLRQDPLPEVIEAAGGIVDETIAVLLGQIARNSPELAAEVLAVLEAADHPRAEAVAATLRRDYGGSAGKA